MRPQLILVVLFSISSFFAAQASSPLRKDLLNSRPTENVSDIPANQNISLEQFVNLSTKDYEKLTGKKLKFKDVLKFKLSQKLLKHKLKKGEPEIPQIGYILLSIVGFGFLAMGILDSWTGNNWWIALLLSFLFWLPGVIFALIKMKEYY